MATKHLKNVKTKQRNTPFTIGIVVICVFALAGLFAVVAQILVYYPLWIFAIIVFIAGVFLLMVELFLLYTLVTGKQYRLESK